MQDTFIEFYRMTKFDLHSSIEVANCKVYIFF